MVGIVARSALPPSAATGVRMALDPGRGRTAVPVRTAMFGAAISLLALSAAVGFGASLNHLVDTPRLAGANWDAIMFSTARGTQLHDTLSTDRDVQGYARGTITNLQADGVGATAIAMRSVRGRVTPSIVEG